jgi:hypothetical protein
LSDFFRRQKRPNNRDDKNNNGQQDKNFNGVINKKPGAGEESWLAD